MRILRCCIWNRSGWLAHIAKSRTSNPSRTARTATTAPVANVSPHTIFVAIGPPRSLPSGNRWEEKRYLPSDLVMAAMRRQRRRTDLSIRALCHRQNVVVQSGDPFYVLSQLVFAEPPAIV